MVTEACYTGVMDQSMLQVAHSHNQLAALGQGEPNQRVVEIGNLVEDNHQTLLDF